MSEKRRDKRNRILREGEYQRADGRYRYRYIDENGKEKWVYSWRLDKNDPTPMDRKRDLSLRENVEKYNKIYRIPMPKVTPHVCRHTFCSNMAKSGMNPKTLQYIMGHSDIGVTLNTYTHVGYEDAQNEMLEIGSLPQETVRLPRKKRVS